MNGAPAGGRALVERSFPRQPEVVTVDEWTESLEQRPQPWRAGGNPVDRGTAAVVG